MTRVERLKRIRKRTVERAKRVPEAPETPQEEFEHDMKEFLPMILSRELRRFLTEEKRVEMDRALYTLSEKHEEISSKYKEDIPKIHEEMRAKWEEALTKRRAEALRAFKAAKESAMRETLAILAPARNSILARVTAIATGYDTPEEMPKKMIDEAIQEYATRLLEEKKLTEITIPSPKDLLPKRKFIR